MPFLSSADEQEEVALDATELAGLVDAARDDSLGMLFTATPREELSEIAQWQRLADQAWCGQVRAVVAAYNRCTSEQREFAADEVALAIGASPTAGSRLLAVALDVAGLPGLLESVEHGVLTSRHALAVSAELGLVDLSVEQRHAVVLLALARYAGQTPGELRKLLARLVLQVDLAAAQARQDKATRGRHVSAWGEADGQGVLQARGPMSAIAAIKARLRADLDVQVLDPSDDRNVGAREFDLLTDLLTRGTVDDQPLVDYSVAVVVPFSTADGGDLELAELPGFGPVLPSTARELLAQASAVTQVAVDPDGHVIAVNDPIARPARHEPTPPATSTALAQQLRDSLTAPPVLRDLSVAGYRIPKKLSRYLEARDRTCTFPGCHRQASRTDKDHRTPWPAGRTSADNLHCLCRHHHRAKQRSFTLMYDPQTGITWWTTRGSWQFPRRPQGY